MPHAMPRPRPGGSGVPQPIAAAALRTDLLPVAVGRDIAGHERARPMAARLRSRIDRPSRPRRRAASSSCDSTAQLICGVPKPRNAQLGVVCERIARARIRAAGTRYGPHAR